MLKKKTGRRENGIKMHEQQGQEEKRKKNMNKKKRNNEEEQMKKRSLTPPCLPRYLKEEKRKKKMNKNKLKGEEEKSYPALSAKLIRGDEKDKKRRNKKKEEDRRRGTRSGTRLRSTPLCLPRFLATRWWGWLAVECHKRPN